MISMIDRSKQNMFALIIGIDDYISCPKLRGAVADAKAMKEYLEQSLGVPKDHIRALFDHNATRDAIITVFQDLRGDERIKQGDPIVIFYAGHGGELSPPPYWTWWYSENKIQCLLPQDYKDQNVHPIPDRTIGALVEEIAKAKGDNICVILDCCHSASGTRVSGEGYVPRSVLLNHTIPKDLDHDIWGGRVGNIALGFAHHGLQSHILLAACGEKEFAYEHDGRGQFTTALLETLKNCAVDDLTYTEVLERIQLSKQSPHCEGLNRYRIIFDVRVPGGRQVRHSVRINERQYVIGAGLAHGVSHGAEFTLYCDRERSLDVVVVNDAATIEDFQTRIAIPQLCRSKVSFAKLTRVGNLPLYLTPGGNLSVAIEEINRRIDVKGVITPTFRLVEDVKEAKLEVAMENDLVVLKVLDELLKWLGLRNLSFKTTLERLTHALGAAAHHYWYLNLTNHSDTKNGVTVDFYLLMEVEKEYDHYGTPLLLPVEPSLCKGVPNVRTSHVIDFVVDPGALYGIKITNHTTRDLYVNAFLFNSSSLSIAPYYTLTSVSSGIPEAPLKQKATLTIGYGPGGTAPFTFSLEEGQDIDIGYLKIFFATRPIDLIDIVQSPPFSTVDTQSWISEEARKARPIPPLQPHQLEDTWFTCDIPVVQRRYGAPPAA